MEAQEEHETASISREDGSGEKAPAAKPEDPSLIPGACRVEGENQLP